MPWINALWGWAQSLNVPPAALPPFVPAPASLDPPAVRQEQFADHHIAVAEHTARQKQLFDRICRGVRLTKDEQDWIAKHSDVEFVEPEPKK